MENWFDLLARDLHSWALRLLSHTVNELVRLLQAYVHENLEELNCFESSQQVLLSCCWDFLTRALVLTCQLKSVEMVTPRNSKLLTISTSVPCMVMGKDDVFSHLRLIISSLVLETFKIRLLALLYSDLRCVT